MSRCERHQQDFDTTDELLVHILLHIYGLEDAMTSAEQDITADTTVIQALAGSLDTIISGIDALKAAVGGVADTTDLDNAIADLKTKVDAAVADVTPASEPAEPVTEPAPDVPVDQPPAA